MRLKSRQLGRLVVLGTLLLSGGAWAGTKTLTIRDMMQFRSIENPAISDDGRWVAFEARPDRGDGEGWIKAANGSASYRVERGRSPQLSSDGTWAAFAIEPSFADKEKSKKDPPKAGLALIRLSDGHQESFDRVKRFSFSKDGRWLAYQLEAPAEKRADKPDSSAGGGNESGKAAAGEEKKEGASEEGKGEKGDGAKPSKKRKHVGTTLVLRRLQDAREWRIEEVDAWSVDEQSRYAAYAVATKDGQDNAIYRLDLSDPETTAPRATGASNGRYSGLVWSREGSRLAFVASRDDDKEHQQPGTLWIWLPEADPRESVSEDLLPDGWVIPPQNRLGWTRDGERLFVGLKPSEEWDIARASEEKPDEKKEEAGTDGKDDEPAAPDIYDIDKLRDKRELDVWHWEDPLIKTHEKKQWNRYKSRTYDAVLWLESGKLVQLADTDVPGIDRPENPEVALASSDVRYQKEITWDGRFQDAYLVDLKSGETTPIAERLDTSPSLSPDGRFAIYYRTPHWYLYDVKAGATRNLTESIDAPFADEDWDYPADRPSYRLAGWMEGDAAALIQDKFDVWRFPTDGGTPVRMTSGREGSLVLRPRRLDREALFFSAGQDILLTSYNDRRKNDGFYRVSPDKPGAARLLEEDKRFSIVAKAKDADVVLYTREDYDEFPDLWVAGTDFSNPRKISDVNPQMADFAWGTSQLVQWTSTDGLPLQGVLILPGNYEPGKRYPVLVYFYRFFSQRLHEFDEVVVNHRPCFPYYASDGYAIFLPDVRFEVGHPGPASVKSIVPGVQKLVDMGIADPKALGLHGHSWSGYQTAYIVTQTNIFAAAAAGAPVSNMTSAYSGIRWDSGLARQFQYEKSQSRIGGSLWEYPERYIENSPVFFADRIQTPLLIEHGDADGAVPWYQSIEFYLALRRLHKPAWFLQYHGEPHHLQKYPNKVDYTLKMKEFFDHFLKGAPAPKWIGEGEPYRGK